MSTPKLLFLFLFGCIIAGAQPLQDRWFYACRYLDSEQDVADLAALVKTASASGLNGMLLSCNVEYHSTWPEEKRERLQAVKRICDEQHVELIPIIWTIGYGTMLNRNPNLCAAMPIIGVPYQVQGRKAVIVKQSIPPIPNGDFEVHEGNDFSMTGWIDQPGVVSFADTQVKHGGACSLRLENFTANPYGHGRICLETALKPHWKYRFSCYVKTEGYVDNPRDSIKLQFYDKKGNMRSCIWPAIAPTQDWTRLSMVFSSDDLSEGYLYAGVWDGKNGKVWIDDLTLEVAGVNEVIRRPGAPFVVRNAQNGQIYEEGKDFEAIPPLTAFEEVQAEQEWENANDSTKSLVLNLTANSAIREGDSLLVDYYHPVRIGRQRSTCMSEPILYEMFRESAKEIATALPPKKWFLSMDEIRAGGTCAACEARHTDMAHILADCISRQRQIIKEVCPEANIYIWSDMLDPAHNAHDNYYSCKGTFAGVWNLIPKDLVIACWYNGDISMPFFANLGFRTLGAAYYDEDSLDGSRKWLHICRQTPHCNGIMYTSWQNKYQLLPDFGKMVNVVDN
jgi:hypothetical protein